MSDPGHLWVVSPPARTRGRLDRRTTLGLVVVLLLVVSLAEVLLHAPASAGPGALAVTNGPLWEAASTNQVPPGTGWFTFHGSENRSGYSPVNGPATENNIWESCDVGQNPPPIRVGPVVDSTRVYYADLSGTVYALNRGTNGSLVWVHPLSTRPTTADLAAPYLLVGGADGYVTALDAQTGSVHWSVNVGGAVVQGVSAAGGNVYVGTSLGTVVGLSLSSGQVLWKTSVGPSVGGALALEGSVLFGVTLNGLVFAVATNGSLLWQKALGAPIDTAPAVSAGRVIVADQNATVTVLAASTGTTLWKFIGQTFQSGDSIETTPAVAPSAVFVATDLGNLYSLALGNGSVLWHTSTVYAGYPTLASPVATPNGLYLPTSDELFTDINPANGTVIWHSDLGAQLASYSAPAADGTELFLGNEFGCIFAFAPSATPVVYPVTGEVRNVAGAPLAGALVDAGVNFTQANALGAFDLGLPNGTYSVTAESPGYVPLSRSLTVSGPIANVSFTLDPVFVYVLSGTVRDAYSGSGVAGLEVIVNGIDGYRASVTTGPGGSFFLSAPNGTAFLSTSTSSNYDSGYEQVPVTGGPLAGLVISVQPLSLGLGSTDPWYLVVLLPLAACGAGVIGVGYWEASRRRVSQGLSPGILSRFGRFVVMRLLLIPGQAVAVLTVLYVFGTFLPAVGQNIDPCAFSVGACSSCSWSNVVCVARAFGNGYGTFLLNMFNGQWGTATFGRLTEPAVVFLQWWAPDSIELAVVALGLSALLAYPVGLLAGWHRESVFDKGTRVTSLVGLLVPSFLLVLLVVTALYLPFYTSLGDPPFGVLPSTFWFTQHGGLPVWIGVRGENTFPTGFPIIDGLLHQDWALETLVIAKTLLQAFAIAVIYVAIFLRYLRHAVAQAVSESHVTAARARGVAERTILWRHTGRRVLPLYVLVFGITLPIYLGTQALIEALFNDNGLGSLLLSEMTHFSTFGIGFGQGIGTGAALHPGNFYQVTIFLLLLVVLFGNLLSDVLARYLDPRLVLRER